MKQFAFPTISLCRELGMWRRGGGGGGVGGLPTISDYQWLLHKHMAYSELNNEHVLGNT